VQLHAVANLEVCGVALERIDLRVAGAQFHPVGAGEDAALQPVVLVLDREGDAHGCPHDDSGNGGGRQGDLSPRT
jgi:hypothetical protein